MRLTRPIVRSLPIAMAIALCAAPLLASAQAYEAGVTSEAQADATESTPVASPPPRKSAQPTKSLMGVAMAALIESAEQTARQRRDAAHQATALDEGRPPAETHAILPSDPASTMSEDAIRDQMAVQDDPL